MRGEIIAIGDELVSGRVVNTTSSFAAHCLFAAGYVTARITTVGDEPEAIEECLLAAIRRSNFVLVTGGLGPTTDDITNEVAAKVLSRPLVLYPEILAQLRNAESQLGLSPLPMRDKLALLPGGAEVLNPAGKAAGHLLVHNGVPLFFLPGVPEELEDHMVRQVLPRLARFVPQRHVLLQRTFKVFGLLETEINARFEDLEGSNETLSVGYYPNFPEVHVTVTVKDVEQGQAAANATFLAACDRVKERLGPAIVAEGEETLEEVVGRLLVEKGGRLGLAESCTGGLVAYRVTQVPGSSEWFERGVVTYSDLAKQEMLGVSSETLGRSGAVSEETALEMVEGICQRANVTHCLALTGIAGPTGGTQEKPVGTVYIALATPERTVVERFAFQGTRAMVQALAAEAALDWLRRFLVYGTYVPGYRSAPRSPKHS